MTANIRGAAAIEASRASPHCCGAQQPPQADDPRLVHIPRSALRRASSLLTASPGTILVVDDGAPPFSSERPRTERERLEDTRRSLLAWQRRRAQAVSESQRAADRARAISAERRAYGASSDQSAAEEKGR